MIVATLSCLFCDVPSRAGAVPCIAILGYTSRWPSASKHITATVSFKSSSLQPATGLTRRSIWKHKNRCGWVVGQDRRWIVGLNRHWGGGFVIAIDSTIDTRIRPWMHVIWIRHCSVPKDCICARAWAKHTWHIETGE